MAFEIWETETRNIVDGFVTEEAALAAVKDAIARHGVSYVASWFLAYENESGDSHEIAAGGELIERALKMPA